MTIYLKKFGTILTSRQSGKEAWLAFQPVLKEISEQDIIIVDFEGVDVLTPSWADEFLTFLMDRYKGRVKLEHTENPSVEASLDTIEISHL